MAPTAPRLATRPALTAYLRHANHCPAGGDLRRCSDCQRLDERARLDDGRRFGWPPDEREGR